MTTHDMKRHCEAHLHRYVLVTTNDQQQFDAIVEGVDNENVSFAIPLGGEMNQQGQESTLHPTYSEGGFGYGYPYYPYYPQYPLYPPYPYYRPRRFQRLILPLTALVALATLPYF
ncbi:hypothetical protein ACM26V_23445 [Salipaludibacillus sp. HK11]|uniref:hypothetical protein n=1 Tax=Salipaludibacillus sp. HK11 TaxID=3394320 RepID=UPI0039FD41FA